MALTRRISLQQLIQFSGQLADLLASGIPLVTGIKLLKQQNLIPLKTAKDLVNHLEQGRQLSDALEQLKYPPMFIAFLKVAEGEGDYCEGLRRSHAYYLSRQEWQNSFKQASMYPLVVLTTVLTAFCFTINFVIPKFMDLYSNMQLKLPTMTIWLINSYKYGKIIGFYLVIVIISILIVQALLKWFGLRTQFQWNQIFIHVPIIKVWMQYSMTHFFAMQLGTLLQAGVPLMRALNLLEEIVPWHNLRSQINKLKDKLVEGKLMAQAINELDTKLLLPFLTQMISIGEATGRLDKVLISMGEIAANWLKKNLDRLIKLLEPMLIVIVGSLIAFTIITLFIPILQLVEVL